MNTIAPSLVGLSLRVAFVSSRLSVASAAVEHCGRLFGSHRANPPVVDLGETRAQDRSFVTVRWAVSQGRFVDVVLVAASDQELPSTDAHALVWVPEMSEPNGSPGPSVAHRSVSMTRGVEGPACFDEPTASAAVWDALKAGLRLAIEHERAAMALSGRR